MVIPQLLNTSPQHAKIMPMCLIVAALLNACLSKLAYCSAGNIAAARPSFSYLRLRQSHAERAEEPLIARRAFIVVVLAVSICLHHARHMDVACRAPASTPSKQFRAGFQAYPADWRRCAHAIGPGPCALRARKIARVRTGRAAAPRRELAAQGRGFALALVLLPVPRLTESGAVACLLARPRCHSAHR